MKRITVSWSLVAALALMPGSAVAEPNSTDRQNAAKECKTLRGMGVAAFRQLYGKPSGAKNAFGKCVSKFAREEEQQREEARANAAKECKAERDDSNFAASHDGKTFAEFYGSNEGDTNAYGKCVSAKAKENKAEADAEDAEQDEATINAARACRAEQKDEDFAASHGDKTFARHYGTERTNYRNAFGKCVSQKAKENEES